MIFGLASGICWFAVFLVGHIAIAHWGTPQTKPLWSKRLLITGAVGIAVSLIPPSILAGSSDLRHGGWLMGVLWGELTYLGLYCLYTPFYYVVVASLSVRTMVMLLHAPDRTLPLKLLQQEFASPALVRQRLATMAANGFLHLDGERYALTAKGRLLASAFAWLKGFWNLGAGG
jgi:hypothetical protein